MSNKNGQCKSLKLELKISEMEKKICGMDTLISEMIKLMDKMSKTIELSSIAMETMADKILALESEVGELDNNMKPYTHYLGDTPQI